MQKIQNGDNHNLVVIDEVIQTKIYLIKDQKVMLDVDLAALYQVETKVLNQAVKRNIERFPSDFMFQLDKEADKVLRSQIVTSSSKTLINQGNGSNLRSQIVTSNSGGRRWSIFAFTEQGIAMLSSVLRSDRAIQVNIQIMRTFTKLRQMLATNKELKEKIEALEQKYDGQFQEIFGVIQKLITEEETPKNPIGFRVE